MTGHPAAARASAACLALALVVVAALPVAYRVDPLAPLIALVLIPACGLAALVLGLRAGSRALVAAGGFVTVVLLPAGYCVIVLISGP